MKYSQLNATHVHPKFYETQSKKSPKLYKLIVKEKNYQKVKDDFPMKKIQCTIKSSNFLKTFSIICTGNLRFCSCQSAMQKKPEGESRIPTDIWAGMGFSKSMPESAIRDKLGQMGISARVTDTSLESGYEVSLATSFSSFVCFISICDFEK